MGVCCYVRDVRAVFVRCLLTVRDVFVRCSRGVGKVFLEMYALCL